VQLNSHLHFDGQCERAFRFYEQVLGGKIIAMLTHGASPMATEVPPEWRGKILHATLDVGGQILMGADVPPDHYQKPQGFAVTAGIKDPAEAEHVFRALSENGTVQMPLQETFWAMRFGMFVDRYGIPWMINCGRSA